MMKYLNLAEEKDEEQLFVGNGKRISSARESFFYFFSPCRVDGGTGSGQVAAGVCNYLLVSRRRMRVRGNSLIDG